MYYCSLSGTFSAVQKVIFMRDLSTEMDCDLQLFNNGDALGGQNDSL